MTIDLASLPAICARLGIRRPSVFGSVARGEDRPESDVDPLVEFSDRVTLLDLVRAERELSVELGRKVDLVTPASVSLHLRERLQKDAKVLYDRAG